MLNTACTKQTQNSTTLISTQITENQNITHQNKLQRCAGTTGKNTNSQPATIAVL